MKLLTAFFFILFAIVACIVSAANVSFDASTVTLEPASNVIQVTAIALLAVYEVIARLVPTVNNISIVHAIVTFLQFLSNKLNVTKD